jgi:hypothetical protein
MLFKNLHLACRVRSGVEAYKRIHESVKTHVNFGGTGTRSSTSLTTKKGKFEDHALTDELEISRTREAYALAGGNADMRKKSGFSPCLLGQKAWRGV